jgi:F-type H+-transporting ATPase subunit b
MVNMGLTLFIQLGLFLGFMWLMNSCVFRPMLRLMDRRDEELEGHQSGTEEANAQAETLETEYHGKIVSIRREASHTAYHARRAAQAAHNEEVVKLRKVEEREVAVAHQEAMAQVEEERRKYPKLTVELAQTITQRLGLEGKQS